MTINNSIFNQRTIATSISTISIKYSAVASACFRLWSMILPEVYRNNLKNREFDKEIPQNVYSERTTIAERQPGSPNIASMFGVESVSENKHSEGKSTQSKTDSSSCFGINQTAVSSLLETPIRYLRACTMDISSAAAAMALFPFTLFKQYHRPHGNLHGRPILMVNGYLGFGSNWHYQRKRLVKEGFGPIYTMNVESFKSIVVNAKQIEKKAEEIRKETGRNDLILIGHSKGGLVASYYATQVAPLTETRVTDVLTIGSPLAGTPLASFGFGDDAHQMRLTSDFHQELRNKIKEHPEIRFFHIASTADLIVSPSSALLEQSSERQFVLSDRGHLSLIFSSDVADQINTWLRSSNSDESSDLENQSEESF